MKIKFGIYFIAAMMLLYTAAIALPPGMTAKPSSAGKASGLDTQTLIDVNSLQMFVTNQGGFAEDWSLVLDPAKNDGLYYPAGTDLSVLYSAGIWIGGLVNGELRLAVGAFDTPEYFQGPADDDGNRLPDDPRFKVYKINKDSTSWKLPDGYIGQTVGGQPYARFDSANHWDDYVDWQDPAVIADGAPLDEDNLPLLIGDQTLWTVFNDGGPHTYTDYGGGTNPLGIEMQSTFWAYNLAGPLGKTIFAKWIIINKSPNIIDSCYVSLWADPDLGNASDDLVGCDTFLSLGYCYNDQSDQNYGDAPPAVGFDFLQGPIIRESDDDPIYASYDFSGDTVFLNTGDTIPQAVVLGMSSFNKYINQGDPDIPAQAYGFMKGFDAVQQCPTCPYVDPVTSEVTKFFGAGDPVAGTGWIDSNPADRRYMLSTGPFTFKPDDTQIVVAAIIVGQGGSPLSSITQLKTNDLLAQQAYDLNFDFPGPPPQPQVTAAALDRQITLSWGTVSEVFETDPFVVSFEGYKVYQGETQAGPWHEIAHFDLANGVDSVYTKVYVPKIDDSDYVLLFIAPENGIQRFMNIERDYIAGGRLHNGKPYYFAVTAYNYTVDPAVPLVFRFNENPQAAIRIVPQDPAVGVVSDYAAFDTLVVEHPTGESDGFVTTFVLDPYKLSGDSYHVVFSDPGGGLEWQLENATKDTVLLSGQTNYSFDSDYPTVDGMLIKVSGPAEGMRDWDIPSGERRYTWAGGAGDYGGMEGFGGAMGWASPALWFGSGTMVVPASDCKEVLLVHATVDVDGNFDTNDTNVSYGYRYGRGFTNPPARPEFTPFIVDPSDCGGYCYQDFTKSVPLSAWDVTVDPPRRLAVAHMENNTEYGLVDGIYWPPFYGADTAADGYSGDNGATTGPREWLWILDADYSETPNPDYYGDVIANDSMPIMYFIVAARRADVAWSQGETGEDQFLIIPNKVLTSVDTFTFVAAQAGYSADEAKKDLEDIRVVPNPYYAYSIYEENQFDRQVRFLGVPEEFTIKIFNIAGDKVRTLESSDPLVKTAGRSWAVWNMATDEGLTVAGGIYIWYLEAPGIGEVYGKMAIFPEVEQLDTF